MLDVRPVLYAPGKNLTFSLSLDLSDMDFAGYHPVTRPVNVSGTVCNAADVLTLDMTASTVLDARCDRCGKIFPEEKNVDFHCLLAQELQSDDHDDIVPLEDGFVDAEDLARTAFVLAMDSKTLCSEECKGLCPRCGANLNDGPCSCGKEPDPRWNVLARLLDSP